MHDPRCKSGSGLMQVGANIGNFCANTHIIYTEYISISSSALSRILGFGGKILVGMAPRGSGGKSPRVSILSLLRDGFGS